MNIIIFSKNRGAQLELLIRSMKKFFKDFSEFNIKILYKFTSLEFEKGYDKLKNLHKDENIIWKQDTDFQKCLTDLFDKTEKYSVFFVDDIVFKEPFSIKDEKFKYFETHGDILCLSMRLHPRLTYCYPANVNMTPPDFKDNNVFLWKGQSGDYGYSMSLDGHIFRSKDIYFYILNMQYDGPNSLEAKMAVSPLFHPKMICYDKSIIVNNPVNKVQQWNNNLHGKITAEFLNEQFLSGKKIDLSPFEGFENTSCHQEIPINFIEI
jgi:hypothetical protein